MGSVLGVTNLTVTVEPPQQVTLLQVVELIVPPGKWTTAGRIIQSLHIIVDNVV